MSGHMQPLPGACPACGGPADDGTCPATLTCPRCGAGPGQRCRLPSGHAHPTLHLARWRAARELDARPCTDPACTICHPARGL